LVKFVWIKCTKIQQVKCKNNNTIKTDRSKHGWKWVIAGMWIFLRTVMKSFWNGVLISVRQKTDFKIEKNVKMEVTYAESIVMGNYHELKRENCSVLRNSPFGRRFSFLIFILNMMHFLLKNKIKHWHFPVITYKSNT
jgi:hypothetical protein